MPSPCPDGQWTHCHGPFRVSVAVARPAGYTEQWMVPVPADGCLAPMSEVTVALAARLATLPADRIATVTDDGDTPQRVAVRLGAELVYRGAPGMHLIGDDDTWTVQTLVWAPGCDTLHLRDHALLAWLWVAQVTEIDLPSACPARVTVTGVATVADRPLPLLSPDYATDPGTGRARRITLEHPALAAAR